MKSNARVAKNHANDKPFDRFQFVRIGYFCVDQDSTPDKIRYNAIVDLKEDAKKIDSK